MTDKTIKTIGTGIAAALTDLFLTRQGAGTEDVSVTGTQLMAFVRNFAYSIAGQGISIKEGTNARMGIATLAAGTVVVPTTAVTANSRVILTPQSLGTVTRPAATGVSARIAGTSFTILSGDVTDTSTVAWVIVEPAP